MKQHIFSITVKNRYGVLSRVAGAFNRRGHNIDSFSSGKTDQDGSYRMTVVSRGDDSTMRLIKGQLQKLIDVSNVHEIESSEAEIHEIALVRVRNNGDNGTHLDMVAATFGAEIVKNNSETTVLRLVSKPLWVDSFLERMEEFDVVSSSRSGAVAI